MLTPLGGFFPDSQVKWGVLELMFSVEYLGLPEQESFFRLRPGKDKAISGIN